MNFVRYREYEQAIENTTANPDVREIIESQRFGVRWNPYPRLLCDHLGINRFFSQNKLELSSFLFFCYKGIRKVHIGVGSRLARS